MPSISSTPKALPLGKMIVFITIRVGDAICPRASHFSPSEGTHENPALATCVGGTSWVTLGEQTRVICRECRSPARSCAGLPEQWDGGTTPERDLSSQFERAKRYAFSLAKKCSARLTLLHVLEHTSENILDERDRLLHAKEHLQELAELHEAAMGDTAWVVKDGYPADSILRTAGQKQADSDCASRYPCSQGDL